jgi:hypothetical protein
VGVSYNVLLILLVPVVALLIIVAALILPLLLVGMGMGTACRVMPAPIAVRLERFALRFRDHANRIGADDSKTTAPRFLLSLALWFIHCGNSGYSPVRWVETFR